MKRGDTRDEIHITRYFESARECRLVNGRRMQSMRGEGSDDEVGAVFNYYKKKVWYVLNCIEYSETQLLII